MVTEIMLRKATAEAEHILLSNLPEDDGTTHVFSKRFEEKMKRLIFRVAHPRRYQVLRITAAVAAVALIISANLVWLFHDGFIMPPVVDPISTDPTEITSPTEDTVHTDPTEDTIHTAPTEDTIHTDPTENTTPTETTGNTDPSETTEPTNPTEDTKNTDPTEISDPTNATEPSKGSDSTKPSETVHVHSWTDATYQRPKHCTTCFKTQGSSLKRPQIRDFGGVTVSIMIATEDTSLDEEWFYEEIERLFGCNISVSRIHPDYYYLKTSEWLSSENPPTIMKIDGPIENCIALGESGKFIDVMAPENLAKMPNFKSLFVDNKANHELLMLTGAEDGSHYILPSYDLQNIENYWFYNEAVFKDAGVQWNGDRDGFLDMLRRLKKYAPDSYPLTGGLIHETFNYVISSFGANSTYAAYNWDKGDWFFGATSDASYEMLRMYQTAYKEGLMNPAMLTQMGVGMVNDLTNQKSFIGHIDTFWIDFLSEAMSNSGRITPASSPVGTNGMNYQIPDFSNTSGTVISTKDPKAAECAMAILDWLYDTSLNGGAWMNTVGTDFMLKTGNNGLLNWIDFSEHPYASGVNNRKEYAGGMFGIFQAPLDVRVHPDSPYYNSCDEMAMAHQIAKELDYFRAAPPLPKMNSSLATQYQKAQDEINQMQLDFITKNWTRADFDKWAADFNATYKSVVDYLNSNS